MKKCCQTHTKRNSLPGNPAGRKKERNKSMDFPLAQKSLMISVPYAYPLLLLQLGV